MSGSYLAGADGEPGGDDVEGEEAQDATMESRGPLLQDGVSMDGHPVIWHKCVNSLLDSLSLSVFFRLGVFKGAKGTKLFSGCGGARLRGNCKTLMFVDQSVINVNETFYVFD